MWGSSITARVAIRSGLHRVRVWVAVATAVSVPMISFTSLAVAQPIDTVSAGGILLADQSLVSADGRYTALVQGDGNFVVYGPAGVVWSTGTRSGSDSQLWMQSDGNLVLYGDGHQPLWSAGSVPSVNDRLTMQNDGNLVLYTGGGVALWSSLGGYTGNHEDTLAAGQVLFPGQSLWSLDGRYQALMQVDGNFVEYGPNRQVLWATQTSTGAALAMQSDGNLVLNAANWVPIWASNTTPSSGTRLVVQGDGNLVIYNSDSVPLWAQGKLRPGAPPRNDYPTQWANAPQDSVLDSWREWNRECTSFVAWRLASREDFTMPFNADATYWGTKAAGLGYSVNSTPTVGAVAWDQSGGHVAFVQAVTSGGITIEEYNFDYHGNYNVRTVSPGRFRYIHFVN